jgi:hypothetical protein
MFFNGESTGAREQMTLSGPVRPIKPGAGRQLFATSTLPPAPSIPSPRPAPSKNSSEKTQRRLRHGFGACDREA